MGKRAGGIGGFILRVCGSLLVGGSHFLCAVLLGVILILVLWWITLCTVISCGFGGYVLECGFMEMGLFCDLV